MANISAIKLPNGTTYNIKDSISGYTTNTGTITQVKTTAGAHTTINVSSGAATFNVPTKTSHLTNDSGFITNAGVTGVKGNAENSYRTGDVNITADNVNAITKNLSGNTQNLRRPSTLQGANDITIDSKINTLRANRLAFLPADQIIIEKTTDGGTTWVDAEIADATKVGLFSETRPSVTIPLLNGKKSPLCGLRFTITAMKYNVPAGTAETAKYNYWNKDYIKSTERYNQLKEMYFWVSTSGGYINVKVERATGANPTNWSVISNDTSFNMTGYSGNDYISFSQGVFGGITTQVNNYWNYRITFMTDDYIPASPYDGYSQSIMEIRGYGDTWWTAGNEYAANDKIFTHDYAQNVFFPGSIYPVSNNAKTLGSSSNKWYAAYATTFYGALSGNATNVTGTVAIANGGTGQTTAANAINALLNGLPTWTADPTDSTYFIRQDTGGSATYGKVKASTIWNYISGKLPAWSKASTKPSYTFSEISSKPTTISGYGITDAKIASGTITLGSNTITPLTSSSTLNAAKLSGAIPSAVTATTQTAGDNSTKIATTAFVSSAISTLGSVLNYKGTKATVSALPTSGNTTGDVWHVTVNSGEYAWDGIEWQELGTAISIPTNTGNSTTGISIAAHGTGTVIGVQSSTTTASKVTVGSSSTDYGVKSAGSASTWTFEEKTIPNVTSAGTASSWTFEEKIIPNVTAAGSGSASLTFAMDTTDTKKLKITFSHTHTAPTIGTAIKVQSKSGGSNGTAPTLGTAIKVQSKSGGANSTAPTLGSKVPTVSATDVTVPIKNASASTFVTSTTHTVTDNGHTHTI